VIRAAGLIGLLALACAHAGPGDRGILLDCALPGANVFVDDVPLHHALRWRGRPMPLRPGPHRIEVTAEGHYPFYGEVTVKERGFETVHVDLRRALD
jgi:hypothetical protein